jgi:gas vesicle protein
MVAANVSDIEVTLREPAKTLVSRLYALVVAAFTAKKPVLSSEKASSCLPLLCGSSAAKALKEVANVVKDKVEDVVELVKEKVEDIVEDVVEDVKEKVAEVVEDVKEKVAEVVEDVKEKVADVVEEVKEKVEEKVEEVKEKVEEKVAELAKAVPVEPSVPALESISE